MARLVWLITRRQAKSNPPQLELSADQSSEEGDAELVAHAAKLASEFSSLDCESKYLGHRFGITRRCRKDQFF